MNGHFKLHTNTMLCVKHFVFLSKYSKFSVSRLVMKSFMRLRLKYTEEFAEEIGVDYYPEQLRAHSFPSCDSQYVHH